MTDKELQLLRQYYICSWETILRNLLAYSEQQVDVWIQDAIAISDLDDGESWTYFEPPVHWMLDTFLVGANVKGPLTDGQVADIQDGLDAAFNDAPKADQPQDMDWDFYRKHVNEVLRPYGGKLPMPALTKLPLPAKNNGLRVTAGVTIDQHNTLVSSS